MLFETDRVLEKGDRVTCTFHIGRREIVADAEVKRLVRIASDKYQYGV